MGRDGKFAVDEATLTAAISQDAQAVARVFGQSVDAANSKVNLIAATTNTVPGAYDVVVSQAATRAEVQSAIFATVGTTEVVNVTVGNDTVAVTATAGRSLADLVQDFNTALASRGMRAAAQVTADSRLLLSTLDYGSTATLSVASSGSGLGLSSVSATGTDVAGTIDGVAATGSGQVLSSTSGNTSGLTLMVRATSTDLAAGGGSLTLATTYAAGASGTLRNIVEQARFAEGSIGIAASAAADAISRIDAEADRVSRLLDLTESRLRKQFAALETALARIKGTTPDFAALSAGSSNQ